MKDIRLLYATQIVAVDGELQKVGVCVCVFFSGGMEDCKCFIYLDCDFFLPPLQTVQSLEAKCVMLEKKVRKICKCTYICSCDLWLMDCYLDTFSIDYWRRCVCVCVCNLIILFTRKSDFRRVYTVFSCFSFVSLFKLCCFVYWKSYALYIKGTLKTNVV